MKVQVDQLMTKFDSLAYVKKYELILGVVEKWKGINTWYAGVYTFLVTSGYISESFLTKVYHHALSLADRDALQKQEKDIQNLVQQHKQTQEKISELERQDTEREDIDDLLLDI